jgi:hypothetical protein
MKTILRFLFNAVRNISFVLVLVAAGYLAVSYFTGDLQRQVERMGRFEQMEQDGLLEASAEDDFESVQSGKVELKAGRTTHFIRPEKTAFFFASQGRVYAVTLQKDTIGPLSSSLKNIAETLYRRDYHYYFQTRDYFFNCHHVNQYFSKNIGKTVSPYNYRYQVVMETGDTVDIPKEKYPSFMAKMDTFAVPIE